MYTSVIQSQYSSRISDYMRQTSKTIHKIGRATRRAKTKTRGRRKRKKKSQRNRIHTTDGWYSWKHVLHKRHVLVFLDIFYIEIVFIPSLLLVLCCFWCCFFFFLFYFDPVAFIYLHILEFRFCVFHARCRAIGSHNGNTIFGTFNQINMEMNGYQLRG